MLLTVDVGNTHTVVGGYDADKLLFMWRISTEKERTEDEIRAKLNSMFTSGEYSAQDVEGVALASVVPALTQAWVKANKDLFGCDTFVCTAETTKGLFIADYPNPHEIGSDRVADAIGALHSYGYPVVIVDFGTATNIEVIDNRGQFVGGIIAPGIESSARALFSAASKIAAIELVAPEHVIGTSTETAVQSGIVFGEVGRVDGLLEGIFAQLGYRCPVVATGGQARVITKYSKVITDVNPQLTLIGLKLAYEYAQAAL